MFEDKFCNSEHLYTFSGIVEVPQKIGPDRFSHFDVYRSQTSRQTDFAKYTYIDQQINIM